MSPNRKAIIQAILTNTALSEEKKSEIIAQIMDEFDKNYPDLKYHATKNDITKIELKLTKEIELIRQDTKEIEKDIKIINKELKQLNIKLEKEITEVKKEIKELEIKLTKDITTSKVDTIKWTAGLIFAQFIALSGLILTMFKFFR